MAQPVLVSEAPAALAERFAAACEQAAARALAERDRFALVIPGGSAAERLLPRLATAAIDWTRTDVFFSDERFVPSGDAASSAAAAQSLLFDALGAHGPRVHAMVGDDPDPVATARDAAADLVATLGRLPVFDLALLGIGEDGHVASLFPGRAASEEPHGLVLVERDSPKPPPTRLTLSLPLLAGSRRVVFAAFGVGKAAILRTVLRDPASTLPAARLLRGAADVLVLLDPAAASALPAPAGAD